MPSVYDFKPRFQALLRPLVVRLGFAGFTANAVTVLAMAGSIVVGAAVSLAETRPAILLLLPLWLFVRMALNAIDGMMARELGMRSALGGILNEVGDVVSDLALYLPLARVRPEALWGIIAFATGAALTEFCGVLAQALGAERQYQGPMGKSDRALLVGALALATFLFPEVSRVWTWVFGVSAVLTVWTSLNRCHAALGQLNARSAAAAGH